MRNLCVLYFRTHLPNYHWHQSQILYEYQVFFTFHTKPLFTHICNHKSSETELIMRMLSRHVISFKLLDQNDMFTITTYIRFLQLQIKTKHFSNFPVGRNQRHCLVFHYVGHWGRHLIVHDISKLLWRFCWVPFKFQMKHMHRVNDNRCLFDRSPGHV